VVARSNHPAQNVGKSSDNGQTDEHCHGVVANGVKTDSPKKESCIRDEGRIASPWAIPRLIALAFPRLIDLHEEQKDHAREDRYGGTLGAERHEQTMLGVESALLLPQRLANQS
jgi:hypothetical protein